jgi:hypothetical protein
MGGVAAATGAGCAAGLLALGLLAHQTLEATWPPRCSGPASASSGWTTAGAARTWAPAGRCSWASCWPSPPCACGCPPGARPTAGDPRLPGGPPGRHRRGLAAPLPGGPAAVAPGHRSPGPPPLPPRDAPPGHPPGPRRGPLWPKAWPPPRRCTPSPLPAAAVLVAVAAGAALLPSSCAPVRLTARTGCARRLSRRRCGGTAGGVRSGRRTGRGSAQRGEGQPGPGRVVAQPRCRVRESAPRGPGVMKPLSALRSHGRDAAR